MSRQKLHRINVVFKSRDYLSSHCGGCIVDFYLDVTNSMN